MIQPSEVSSPSFSTLLFFRARQAEDSPAAPSHVLGTLAGQLGMTPGSAGTPGFSCWGKRDGVNLTLDFTAAHDTYMLRLACALPGRQPTAAWGLLEQTTESMLKQLVAVEPFSSPWGATRIYQAVKEPAELVTVDTFPTNRVGLRTTDPEPSPFGWTWLLEEGDIPLVPKNSCWVRSLGLLVPAERIERVIEYYLGPLTQGLPRIELYLHKAKHHARLQAVSHDHLDHARQALQESMAAAAAAAEFGKDRRDQQALDLISKRLMHFLAQIASQEVLLNSLQANRQGLEEHLGLVRLELPLYQNELLRLGRHIAQLEADIRNARAVLDSTYAFQEIHRSVETVRLERASMLMSAAAALLAGVAIFNSFLDIWNLALEGSGLQRPSSWLRILLGFTAGVSFPLAAAWVVEKRAARAAISALVGLLAVAVAILATMLVNA